MATYADLANATLEGLNAKAAPGCITHGSIERIADILKDQLPQLNRDAMIVALCEARPAYPNLCFLTAAEAIA